MLNRLRGTKRTLRNIYCELHELHRGECLLCEGPMICAELIVLIGRSLVHRIRMPRQRTDTFLDAVGELRACDCLHCRSKQKVGRAHAA